MFGNTKTQRNYDNFLKSVIGEDRLNKPSCCPKHEKSKKDYLQGLEDVIDLGFDPVENVDVIKKHWRSGDLGKSVRTQKEFIPKQINAGSDSSSYESPKLSPLTFMFVGSPTNDYESPNIKLNDAPTFNQYVRPGTPPFPSIEYSRMMWMHEESKEECIKRSPGQKNLKKYGR